MANSPRDSARSRPSPAGSRSRGRGRGSYRGRGRGKAPYIMDQELDFSLQLYPSIAASSWRNINTENRGYSTPRGASRGGSPLQSGRNTPSTGQDSPRGSRRGDGRGFGSARGDRGRGRGGSKLRPDAPLSGLLYQERPFLRPVIFVPSVQSRTLFQQEDDILELALEDVGDDFQSHAPTADRVARVFSGGNIPRVESSESEDDMDDNNNEEEELEVIDFNDMGQLLASGDTTSSKKTSPDIEIVEQQFTGFFIDEEPSAVSTAVEITVASSSNLNLPSEKPSTQTMNEANPLPPSQETLEGSQLNGQSEDTLASSSKPTMTETSFDNDNLPIPIHTTTQAASSSPEPAVTESSYYIDTLPSPVPTAAQAVHPTAVDDEEEIIVYVAPHRRAGPQKSPERNLEFEPYNSLSASIDSNVPVSASPNDSESALQSTSVSTSRPSGIPQAPAFDSVSFSFSSLPPSPSKPSRLPPLATRRVAKSAQAWERKKMKRLSKKIGKFGSYGAMMEENMLRGSKVDKRKSERRQGDSDLDWGSDDVDDSDDQERPSVKSAKGKGKESYQSIYAAEGMDIDPELEMNVDAMRQFAGGLIGSGSGRFMTMDDINDAEIMKMEDEGDEEGSDEDSVDEAAEAEMKAAEALLVGEGSEGGEEESDDSDGDDDSFSSEERTPRSNFQARLERLRRNAQTKKREVDDISDMDEDDFFSRNMSWAEEDEAFIEHIQDILDENDAIMTGHDRKGKNKLFNAIRDGAFDALDALGPAKRRKDKGKDLPPDLKAQWEKDRQKKAERKKQRNLDALERAADPMAKKKGGKKGRKAMLKASRLDPTLTVLPNRVIDMVTLVQQIRRFLQDVGGPSEMSLPPTNKETRKNIHEMALAFNLKSVSKGKNDTRYTTLIKTTRSGFGINEAKIARIVRRSGGAGSRDNQFMNVGKNGAAGRGGVLPHHREGDEVGKAAPKIGESNLGFRMLASMGWAEGDRIGISGGLDVPLTAIIKNTKLGLGAMK